METIQGNKNLATIFKTNVDVDDINAVKRAEIKLSAFFAANTVAFRMVDQLEPVLKDIFPDSNICRNMTLKQTKCTEIINNVLCKKEADDLVLTLRAQHFSILLDESTNIGEHKSVALLVRYIKTGKNRVKTRLAIITTRYQKVGSSRNISSVRFMFRKTQYSQRKYSGSCVRLGKCDGQQKSFIF